MSTNQVVPDAELSPAALKKRLRNRKQRAKRNARRAAAKIEEAAKAEQNVTVSETVENRLCCRGLPLDMTQEHLEGLFEDYTQVGESFLSRMPRVRKGKVGPTTRFGYITLSSADECERAIADLNDAEFESDGSNMWTLLVSMAKPRKVRQPKAKAAARTSRANLPRGPRLKDTDEEVMAALSAVNVAGLKIRKAKKAGEDETPFVPELLAAKRTLEDLVRPKAEAAKTEGNSELYEMYLPVLQRVMDVEERRASRKELKKLRAERRRKELQTEGLVNSEPSSITGKKRKRNRKKRAKRNSRSDPESDSTQLDNTNTLFCGGLPQDMTEENLGGLFDDYTIVGETFLSRKARVKKGSDRPPRPRYGYVKLASADECEKAIVDLNGADFDSDIDGAVFTWTLVVAHAKPRKQPVQKTKKNKRQRKSKLRAIDAEVATALDAVHAVGRKIKKAKRAEDQDEAPLIPDLEAAKKALGDLVRPKYEAAKQEQNVKMMKLYLPVLQRVMNLEERRASYAEQKQQRAERRAAREAAATVTKEAETN